MGRAHPQLMRGSSRSESRLRVICDGESAIAAHVLPSCGKFRSCLTASFAVTRASFSAPSSFSMNYEGSVGPTQNGNCGDLMSVLIIDRACQAGIAFARPSLKTRVLSVCGCFFFLCCSSRGRKSTRYSPPAHARGGQTSAR